MEQAHSNDLINVITFVNTLSLEVLGFKTSTYIWETKFNLYHHVYIAMEISLLLHPLKSKDSKTVVEWHNVCWL